MVTVTPAQADNRPPSGTTMATSLTSALRIHYQSASPPQLTSCVTVSKPGCGIRLSARHMQDGLVQKQHCAVQARDLTCLAVHCCR